MVRITAREREKSSEQGDMRQSSEDVGQNGTQDTAASPKGLHHPFSELSLLPKFHLYQAGTPCPCPRHPLIHCSLGIASACSRHFPHMDSWLLPPSMLPPKLLPMAACVSFTFCGCVIFQRVDLPHSVYPSTLLL